MVTEQQQEDMTRLILSPNRSLDWRGNKRFLIAIAALMLVIAIWFAWLGAWLVLPFAGLELGLLTFALYWVSRQGLDKEVVTITADMVEVSRGRKHPVSTTRIQRCWMQVRLIDNDRNWYPSRLLLRSHGVDTEIGGFLGESERVDLARKLEQIV